MLPLHFNRSLNVSLLLHKTCIQVQDLSHAEQPGDICDFQDRHPFSYYCNLVESRNISYHNLTDRLDPLLNKLPNKMESNFEYTDRISAIYGCGIHGAQVPPSKKYLTNGFDLNKWNALQLNLQEQSVITD